jgi:phosphoribosyl-AMP cyclohydrolase
MNKKASAAIDFDKSGGVVPVITQDFASHRVLMVAYMNREAFEETVATGRACYYSRSRNRLWRKGEESGNFQVVREIRLDCDADTILIAVEQRGDAVACAEGYQSCFFRALDGDAWKVVDPRPVDPAKYGRGYGHQKKSSE